MEELISRYGYAAIFILTFFEGESVLIAAGFIIWIMRDVKNRKIAGDTNS